MEVSIDDYRCPEVERINSYATFLQCLVMANGGLSLLVFTWTTVILLGGFVSVVQKMDFWCLTVITFVQMAGVVDAFMLERVRILGYSTLGHQAVMKVLSRNRMGRASGCRARTVAIFKQLLGFTASLVQFVAFIVALLVFLFIALGAIISTGIALYRLIEHDYGTGDGSDPNKANMNSALDVLYILVVVQGAIFSYAIIIERAASKKLVAQVVEEYGFQGPAAVTFVEEYMKGMQKGCFKDIHFAKGKNLVTYAVHLMGPDKSHQDYFSRLRILSTLLSPSSTHADKFSEQYKLIKKLIVVSPSSSNDHILEKLLQTSGPRKINTYDRELSIQIQNESEEDKEMRKYAARILVHVADEARPEQLPQVIECISSMIDTFGEYHQRAFCSDSTGDDNEYARNEEKGYKEFLLHVLCTLFVLAADKNSCRVIKDTRGLLTKIIAPLTSDLLHLTDHDAWGCVVEESLRVMHRLIAAPGETGANLRREISINNKAITNMERIVACNHCNAKLHVLAMEILTKLHMESESKEDFIKMLVGICTDGSKDTSTKILAVEALAMLCSQDGSNATIILEVNAASIDHLTLELAASGNGYHRHLISAAEILEHLCIHYTKKDECFEKLKKAMIDSMPKVLSKIFPGDVEDQQGRASQDDSQNRSSSCRQESQEQRDDRETKGALLSLCVTVCDTFISEDQHLALQFQFDVLSLPSRLRGMVERNSDPTVSCLKLLKLVSKMVISMMKHSDNIYRKQDMESLPVALLRAYSGNMSLVISSMAFSSSDDDGVTTTKKPQTALKSLVDKASKLVLSYKPQE